MTKADHLAKPEDWKARKDFISVMGSLFRPQNKLKNDTLTPSSQEKMKTEGPLIRESIG